MNNNYIFWKNQKIMKDYRQNKLFYFTTSSLITMTPLFFFYGLNYGKYIRKIPFHIQLGIMIIFYKSTSRFIQEFRYLIDKLEIDFI